MPTPPREDESQDDFISRCMSAQADEDTPQDQKLAICFSMWRERSQTPSLDAGTVAPLEQRDIPVHYRGAPAYIEQAGPPVIRGYAIVFNTLSERLQMLSGTFRERIRPSAIERTLRDQLDVRALFNHDSGQVLGRIGAKTLQLEADHHGLRVRIDPPTWAGGIVESIRRGDITGMSFAFGTLKDSWHQEAGEDIREIHDMAVHDVSVVTFPAYGQTDVAVAERSYRASQRRAPAPGVWVPLLTHQHRQRVAEWERRRRS